MSASWRSASTLKQRPHVVFGQEPHRSDLVHFRSNSGLVPAHVLTVNRDAGTVTLNPLTHGVPVTTATYTVDRDERSEW